MCVGKEQSDARVRLLATASTNKNDPNDARSVAVTALRAPGLREVRPEDHCAVMKLWARRAKHLSSARTRTACRLHAALCDLVPGGFTGEISAGQAGKMIEGIEPMDAVGLARLDLAKELLADMIRLDGQIKETRARLKDAVAVSGTSLTDLYGVGPVIAAMVIGYAGDVSRFASRNHFASYTGTAPIEVSSGSHQIHRLSRRGNRQMNHAIHMSAVTQIRHQGNEGRAYFDRKVADGKTKKEALRALKRRISDALYRQPILDAQRKSSKKQERVREGKQGATLNPPRPVLALNAGSSEKPLPDPAPRYGTSDPRRPVATRRPRTDSK
ncbi:MAG: transposase [Acidimicrobiales bacterium]